MIKRIPFYILIIINLFFAASCDNMFNDAYGRMTEKEQGDDPGDEPGDDGPTLHVHVHVAGTATQIGDGYSNAVWWDNGTVETLTDYSASNTGYAKGNSVFVYNGKAYISGTDSNVPFYRIGAGDPVALSNGTEANSIFVNADGVYVAGQKYSGGNFDAVYWENGVITTLPYVGEHNAGVKSIFVYNGDIYTAGYDYDGDAAAVYWKISSRVQLRAVAFAESVYVYNSDIYVAGYYRDTVNRAACWKNGILESLTEDDNYAAAYSVFVYKGDVYVAGHYNNGTNDRALYWKNGTATYLTDGTNSAAAKSVFVFNDDVYVAGYEDSGASARVAKYWKNGEEVLLSDAAMKTAANSIFVSEY